MPLLETVLTLVRCLTLHRVPVVCEGEDDLQALSFCELDDLVETLETVCALIDDELTILD